MKTLDHIIETKITVTPWERNMASGITLIIKNFTIKMFLKIHFLLFRKVSIRFLYKEWRVNFFKLLLLLLLLLFYCQFTISFLESAEKTFSFKNNTESEGYMVFADGSFACKHVFSQTILRLMFRTYLKILIWEPKIFF